VQAWRTTEFPKGSPDSRVEIILETIDGGTKLTLLHSNIPEGQADDYKKGWQEFYFDPMKEYFG
jgi:activator of HSP90 ATPase